MQVEKIKNPKGGRTERSIHSPEVDWPSVSKTIMETLRSGSPSVFSSTPTAASRAPLMSVPVMREQASLT